MSHFDTVIEETTDPIVRSVCVTRETLNVEPHLCSLIHDNQRVYGDMYFTEGCEHKDCFEDGKLRLSRNADAVYRIKLVDCVDVRTFIECTENKNLSHTAHQSFHNVTTTTTTTATKCDLKR